MEPKKNLCAMIPLSLHQRVRAEQENAEQSLGDYITVVLTEYFARKDGDQMNGKTRTLAFQVTEEFYRRVKVYLANHRGLSQKDFVVQLIEKALSEWEAEQAANAPWNAEDGESGGSGEESGDSGGDVNLQAGTPEDHASSAPQEAVETAEDEVSEDSGEQPDEDTAEDGISEND